MNISKYGAFIILISAYILIFANCQRQPTGPEEAKIRLVLEYTSEIKKNLDPFQSNAGSSLSKQNGGQSALNLHEIDQAKILILDMTKWNDIEEFENAWDESEQELQWGSMPETVTWDWYANIFRSYQGEYFLCLWRLGIGYRE